MVNEFKSGGMVSTMKLALSGALACETFDSEAMLSARSVIMPSFKERAFAGMLIPSESFSPDVKRSSIV